MIFSSFPENYPIYNKKPFIINNIIKIKKINLFINIQFNKFFDRQLCSQPRSVQFRGSDLVRGSRNAAQQAFYDHCQGLFERFFVRKQLTSGQQHLPSYGDELFKKKTPDYLQLL